MKKIIFLVVATLVFESSFGDLQFYDFEASEKAPFIPKCCSYGSSIVLVSIENSSEKTPACRNTAQSRTWTGFFYDKVSFRPIDSKNLHYEQKVLNCKHYNLIRPSFLSSIKNRRDINIKLHSDGTAVRYCRRCPCKKWQPVPKEFCIDGLGEEISNMTMYYSGNETDQIVGYCPEIRTPEITGKLYTWAFFVSSVFYLITATVYALLWETQNVHGWIIFSLVLSRFFMCIFLGIGNIIVLTGRSSENRFTCTGIGILAHFFTLSSFTWLSIINFDFWWTFRTFKPRSDQSGHFIRLLAYQTLAWSLPALVVGISVIMDGIYRDTDFEVPIPDYGNGICFVTPCARGPYIYFVLAILLATCLIFGTLTFWNIWKARRDTDSIRQSKNTVDSKGYLIYAKLSVIMGTTWIFELISWLSTVDDQSEHWIWVFVDVFNLVITAGLIFAIFICKRKILVQLERKYKGVQASVTQYPLSSLPVMKTNWFLKLSTLDGSTDLPSTDASSSNTINNPNKSCASVDNNTRRRDLAN